jgi:hypothetical protein
MGFSGYMHHIHAMRTTATTFGLAALALVAFTGCCGGAKNPGNGDTAATKDSARPAIGEPLGVAALDWMVGEWTAVQEDSSTMTEKFWKVSGGELVGTSRMVGSDGAIHHSEEIRIVAGSNGKAIYRALAKGQPSHDFPIVSNDGRSVVFEDPAHDFPSWMRYTLSGDTMKIELKGGGPKKGLEMDFELRRAGAK